MPPKGMSAEEAQKMVDNAVRILREDAQLAHNRQLMERLDRIEKQTVKEPQTPEEKAAAYDKLVAERNNASTIKPSAGNPVQPTGSQPPSPPNPKPPTPQNVEKDWWWGADE